MHILFGYEFTHSFSVHTRVEGMRKLIIAEAYHERKKYFLQSEQGAYKMFLFCFV